MVTPTLVLHAPPVHNFKFVNSKIFAGLRERLYHLSIIADISAQPLIERKGYKRAGTTFAWYIFFSREVYLCAKSKP